MTRASSLGLRVSFARGASESHLCQACVLLKRHQGKPQFCLAWWHLPRSPTTQEAEAGGSQIAAQPRKFSSLLRPYQNLKTNLTKKLGVGPGM